MSSKRPAAPAAPVPAHVAVIMDGNGRWAQRRFQPRAMGHRAGVRVLRKLLRSAHESGVRYLTVFAFSQENWRRPPLEVKLLMQLFASTLAREAKTLHRNGVRLRFIGNRAAFSPELQAAMEEAAALTRDNTGLQFQVAVDYGGQWDIAQAAQRVADAGQPITVQAIEQHLETADLPAPDLMIRTGGEQRISNFMLWQLAYTELYFCDTLWPDFDAEAFGRALDWYASRDRRFGALAEPV